MEKQAGMQGLDNVNHRLAQISRVQFCIYNVLVIPMRLMPDSLKIFRGRPNISVGQPILVQPKYTPT